MNTERVSRWVAYFGVFAAGSVLFTAGLSEPFSLAFGVLLFAQYLVLQFRRGVSS